MYLIRHWNTPELIVHLLHLITPTHGEKHASLVPRMGILHGDAAVMIADVGLRDHLGVLGAQERFA